MSGSRYLETSNLTIRVQVALIIRGFFICEFAYSRLTKVNQTSVFADFDTRSLAYMQFWKKKAKNDKKNQN